MKCRLFYLLATVSLLLFVGMCLVCAGQDGWVRRSRSFRELRPSYGGEFSASTWDAGSQSIGLYAHGGRIGIIAVRDGIAALDATEIGPRTQDSATWQVSRGTHDDGGYLGGIPEDLVPASVIGGLPHVVYVCDYDDAGMRHFLHIHAVLFNCWLVLLATTPLPIIAFADAIRRRRRRKVGRCLSCGYDLRATPDRCPECGAVTRKNRDHIF